MCTHSNYPRAFVESQGFVFEEEVHPPLGPRRTAAIIQVVNPVGGCDLTDEGVPASEINLESVHGSALGNLAIRNIGGAVERELLALPQPLCRDLDGRTATSQPFDESMIPVGTSGMYLEYEFA